MLLTEGKLVKIISQSTRSSYDLPVYLSHLFGSRILFYIIKLVLYCISTTLFPPEGEGHSRNMKYK